MSVFLPKIRRRAGVPPCRRVRIGDVPATVSVSMSVSGVVLVLARVDGRVDDGGRVGGRVGIRVGIRADDGGRVDDVSVFVLADVLVSVSAIVGAQ